MKGLLIAVVVTAFIAAGVAMIMTGSSTLGAVGLFVIVVTIGAFVAILIDEKQQSETVEKSTSEEWVGFVLSTARYSLVEVKNIMRQEFNSRGNYEECLNHAKNYASKKEWEASRINNHVDRIYWSEVGHSINSLISELLN